MSISPLSIMKGAEEVKRSEVYSALAKNGIQQGFHFKDKKLEAMTAVQIVAFVVLFAGIASLVPTVVLSQVVQVPAVFFVLEGGAIAVGIFVPLAVEGAKQHYLQKKLNAAQVSAILQEARETLGRQWEQFTLSPGYQYMVQTELQLSQLQKKIQPFEYAPSGEGYSDGYDPSYYSSASVDEDVAQRQYYESQQYNYNDSLPLDTNVLEQAYQQYNNNVYAQWPSTMSFLPNQYNYQPLQEDNPYGMQ